MDNDASASAVGLERRGEEGRVWEGTEWGRGKGKGRGGVVRKGGWGGGV